MKKKFKIFLIILAVAAVAAGAVTAAVTSVRASDESQFEYITENGEATIKSITPLGRIVKIPETLGGCPVAAINAWVINDGFDCVISRLYIPSTVKSIDAEAFCNGFELRRFEVDKENEYYATDKKGVLFSKDMTELVQYPLGAFRKLYEIPAGTKGINDFAFYQATYISKVIVPEGVTHIGVDAFCNAHKMNEIVLPDSIESVGRQSISHAFNSEELPANLKEIGDSTFAEYEGTDLVIPDGVVSIGSGAFRYCQSLETVTIPASVEAIGEDAFYGCEFLTRYIVHPDNKNYSSDDFGVLYNKDKTEIIRVPQALTEFCYPETMTHIGQEFVEHERILRISVPGSITSMDECAFYASRLEIIEFFDTKMGTTKLEEISDGAFAKCDCLTEVRIPQGVKVIGEKAFAQCDNVQVVELSDTVEEIEDGAFLKCGKVNEITIPENVKEIGENAVGYFYSVPVEKEHNRGKIEGFVIHGAENSAAAAYAEENGFEIIAA